MLSLKVARHFHGSREELYNLCSKKKVLISYRAADLHLCFLKCYFTVYQGLCFRIMEKRQKKYIDAYLQKLLLVCFIFIDAPSGTRGGVEEYEAMEVDTDGGPGPQRCKYTTTSL